MIKVKTDEDYILYDIECDYCDKVYELKMSIDEVQPKQIIECCPFCGNLIEEPAERIDEEDSWN